MGCRLRVLGIGRWLCVSGELHSEVVLLQCVGDGVEGLHAAPPSMWAATGVLGRGQSTVKSR
jgi:hypothetical protein